MARQQTQGAYKNVRLPLIGALSNRTASGSKDQRFINIYPETRKVEQIENTKIFLQKRAGLHLYSDVVATGEGRGMTLFQNIVYYVVGDKVWADTPSTPTLVLTLTTSTGQVGIVQGNSSTQGDYIFMCDGVNGYVITGPTTYTLISDPDFPTPHVPSPTFIDGYVLVAKGSDVYNSDLDEPDAWNASNFLSAEIFPDPVVALARQNNQVVVFGSKSVEFFYDAANASGSPLSNNDGTVIRVGCAAPYALYQNEMYTAYIGQTASGGRAVWFIEGFRPYKVSDEYIERILETETNMDDCRGFGIRVLGHMFYVINLITIGRTLVFDIDEKLWHEWSSYNAGEHSIFKANFSEDSEEGVSYLQDSATGVLYQMFSNHYTDDNAGPILVELVTNKIDMDVYQRKFASSLVPVADRYEVDNSIDISWSDDDYATYNTPINVPLTDDYPNIQRLGSFRRRAFKITHQLNQPLRLESLELVYKEGVS